MKSEISPELAHYQALFELGLLGTAHLELKTLRVVWANEVFASMLGYSVEELIGLSLGDLSHPEDFPRTRERIAEIKGGDLKTGLVERRYRHKLGHYVWLQITATVNLDEQAKPSHLIGILQDISARKEQEERLKSLRLREARLGHILELGKIGMWELNPINGEVKWSKVFKEQLGYGEEVQPSNELFDSLIHPEDRAQVRGDSEALRFEGRVVFPPFRIIRRDGEIRWLQNVGTVVREGDILIGAIVDITHLKEAELMIEAQRAKMISASKMSALGEMAGGLAHEINNPVAIIHGNAELLKHLAARGVLNPDSVKNSAEIISQTADRIAKITRSLRAFARDAEQDPFEKVTLKSVIEETAEFCRERFLGHGIEFQIEEVDPSLVLDCRPVQISQVLLNLLNNSHDAVEFLERRWIKVGASDLGDTVEIHVSDSGPGISSKHLDRVFQPFFTTKEVGKGTGLGLSVARGLTESHSGNIRIDDKQKFTRFVVTLPKRHRKV